MRPSKFVDKFLLGHPRTLLLCLCLVFGFFAYMTRYLALDASADSLILEHDEDLHYYREIIGRYQQSEHLIVTYAPKTTLFSDQSLSELRKLRDELRLLTRVGSVMTILDVPLLRSPPVPLKDLKDNVTNLDSPTVDLELAQKEFRESPVYQDLLVSRDLEVTALQLTMVQDEKYRSLMKRRSLLRDKQAAGSLGAEELLELKKVSEDVRQRREYVNNNRHQDISRIRTIIDKYRSSAEIYLGGVPMIADDMITFIRNDLYVFGVGIVLFMILALAVIFRRLRWILLPMLCCAFSVVIMTGMLGILGWEITVISSNFISLQVIITMSLTIHLMVRYRELALDDPDKEHRMLILDTICSTLRPCLFTAMTTIAGFSSLIVSDILPVINFGWMMSLGIIVSLFLVFVLFPTLLMLLPKSRPRSRKHFGQMVTSACAGFTISHGKFILLGSAALVVVTAVGITRLTVENCFVNYFRESTEIHQGLKLIDQRLGGTTPLDVIIDFGDPGGPVPGEETAGNADDDFEGFEEFDGAEDDDKYWFTAEKIETVLKVHDYLDGLPETGKVLSLGTMIKVVEQINDGKSLDGFDLALLYDGLPNEFKEAMLKPFVSMENNQVRLMVRIRDTRESLRRDALLKKIRFDLEHKLGLKKDRFALTGVMVLYNNMLQSLFKSQIMTIGVVVLVLMIMFMILFRSLGVALIAIFPNVLSSLVVLGVMGFANIPLDMMTITIVAISIGIAVDDTIHYIYRFKEEFKLDHNYTNTVRRCHVSIGRAMCYTSVTVVVGFSILALSNFIPSVLFGLLTGLAMVIALFAAMTLLPRMLMLFKPFGPERNS